MNIKRVFGTVLTSLGIAGLIYAAILLANKASIGSQVRSAMVYGVLGLVFLLAGIRLILTTKDES